MLVLLYLIHVNVLKDISLIQLPTYVIFVLPDVNLVFLKVHVQIVFLDISLMEDNVLWTRQPMP